VNRNNTLTQGTNNLITAISGDGGFAQIGSGTTEFALANVYTGPTTIAAGTLKLNVSGVLPDTSAVSIGSATLNTADGVAEETGTLAVTGTATINLGAGATLIFDDSELQDWTGGSLNITGDFTNTSIKFATSGGLEVGQLAVISVNGSGTGTYTLDPSGYLVPGGGGSAYDTWAGGPGLPFDGDANGDGVSNGLAFLLGAADKDENAINKLPTVTQSGGDLVLDFNCLPVSARGGATFKVEHSTDLAGWTATTGVVPDADNAVPDNNVTFVVGAGPVGPPALNSVQATIGSAAAAGGGKLFARLKAENP
jgi:autotransporter-associated beta strand protein